MIASLSRRPLARLLLVSLVAAAPSLARADVLPDDMTPPSIAITAPKNGSVHEPPASFIVSISATDIGTGVAKVELTVDGAAVGEPDTEAPYNFNVEDLAVGSHTLVATATDGMGNTSTAMVTIEVQVAGASTGETDTGGGGEMVSGCGCTHAPAGDGLGLAALGLVLLAGRRRRGQG